MVHTLRLALELLASGIRTNGNAFVIMLSLYSMARKLTFRFVTLVPVRDRKMRPIDPSVLAAASFITSQKNLSLYSMSKKIPFLFVSLVMAMNRKI